MAISGIPPFAGFFSKDEILSAALAGNTFYFVIELLVAGLTAYYMFRLYFRIFWNKETSYEKTPHEAPLTMTIPLMILAALAMVTGFIPFGKFVSADSLEHLTHMHWDVAIGSTVVGLIGIFIAMRQFKNEKSESTSESGIYRIISNKFYVDELYQYVTHSIIFKRISKPVAWFDRNVVDASMNGVAWITNAVSSGIKGLQSGQVQDYLVAFASGIVVLFIVLMYLIS